MARMRGSTRRRSLRDRAFVVAILVGAAPFMFLVSMSRLELSRASDQAARLNETAALAGEQLDSGSSLAEIQRVLGVAGSAANQRIRIAQRDGTVLLDVDRSLETNASMKTGDFFYGPAGPGLSMLESESGPIARRAESLAPTRGADARLASGGNLILQSLSVWRPGPHEVQVHVQGFSRRAALPQFATQRQIIKWLSLSVAIALVAAWLLSRRLLAPIEQLRSELLARTASAVPMSRLAVERADEVGELARAFETVFAALAQQKAANQSFVADLAHELKNPVAAIRTCADVLNSAALTPEKTIKLTGVLHDSSAQLDRLVTQFLDLSRAEAGLPAEQRELVHLQALVDGLRATFERDPRFASVSWRGVRLQAGDAVNGVPVRLERAFGNLILNALSFSGETGWVQIDVRKLDGEIEVSVLDSGPGIDSAQLPRLFERFHTTRGDAKGTGLGLALTRAIIEAHGGTVHAASPASGGAAFIVQLPSA